MKMTLKNRIAQSQEVLSNCDFQNCMDSNDKIVVFYASAMVGSRLSQRYSDILMNRNAVPNWWDSNSFLYYGRINFALKEAYAKVVEYLEWGYNITPGRLMKLLDILSCIQPNSLWYRKDLISDKMLNLYLRNLNNLRMHYKEMTNLEIYDFSFDMVYDFLDNRLLSDDILSLSFLIMYWIQRECDLIPLAVPYSKKDEFLSLLDTQSGDMFTQKEKKKEFRLFMRKLLDLHLKVFIKNTSSKDGEKSTSRDRILKLLKDNPTHTAKTMASCLGLSVQAIQKQIAILKAEKRLKRIGPDHGGSWKVLEKEQLMRGETDS